MIKAGAIAKGMFLLMKNEPHLVVDREFVNPGIVLRLKAELFHRLLYVRLQPEAVSRLHTEAALTAELERERWLLGAVPLTYAADGHVIEGGIVERKAVSGVAVDAPGFADRSGGGVRVGA